MALSIFSNYLMRKAVLGIAVAVSALVAVDRYKDSLWWALLPVAAGVIVGVWAASIKCPRCGESLSNRPRYLDRGTAISEEQNGGSLF
jgi:hypothetical protein